MNEIAELRFQLAALELSKAERKQVDEALQENIEKLRIITDTAKDAIVMMDNDGNISFWNPAAETIFGYTSKEAIGRELHIFLSPERYHEDYRRGFERFKETGEGNAIGKTLELIAIRKDGTEFKIELSLSAIQIKEKWQAVGIIRDVTQRKKAEEELRAHREHLTERIEERTRELKVANENLLKEITERKQVEDALRIAVARAEEEKSKTESIIAAIGDAISIQDTDFKILYQNQIHKDMLKDHVGETCYIAYRQRATPCEGCPVEMSFKNGMIHKGERIVTNPGGGMYIEVTASPLRNSAGNIIAGIEVIRDITERKRMEAELQKTQRLESIGMLAGGLAHEFNNILTAIMGNVSLAKMYAKPGLEIFDILIEVEKASQRAKNLTTQLLTFSKGGVPIKKATNLTKIVTDSANFALSGANVRCEFVLPENLWPVDIDEGQISQAINNIIINAKDAMPQGGIVGVSAENIDIDFENFISLREGKYVKLSIKDQGTGIPEENIQKIFDPFFTTKQEGNGIGLTTSYSIVKKHEGCITVESDIGSGTTFHIYLPASEEMRQPADDAGRLLISRRGMGRILVMDDDEIVRAVAVRMIAQCGYEVAFARDGAEAVEMYKKAKDSSRPYDVVILDLIIPAGMGGSEAIKKLIEIDPNVKAIVSSGYSSDPIIANFREYGFKGALAKPYEFTELKHVLQKVTKGKKANIPSPL
ncbi:MAG: PAS domain S-box protein [Nitrospirae bacterium]|nr:PAS domain S-box protein [Nitrospirota bacterium]